MNLKIFKELSERILIHRQPDGSIVATARMYGRTFRVVGTRRSASEPTTEMMKTLYLEVVK